MTDIDDINRRFVRRDTINCFVREVDGPWIATFCGEIVRGHVIIDKTSNIRGKCEKCSRLIRGMKRLIND